MSALLIVFRMLFTYAPQMQHVLRTAALGAASWLIALALGLGKFLAVEARKAVLRAFQVRNM
jgi:hypothetical protein